MTSSDSRPPCWPTFATARTSDRETLGREATRISLALGEEPLEWQQLVYDVGLEIDPDTGDLAYREVVVTVPRQSGKTTLFLVFAGHRCVPVPGSPRPWGSRQRQRVAFTMQTGWDAHKKLVNDLGPKVIASPLGAALDPSKTPHTRDGMTKGVGNAALLFKGGSRIDVVSSSDKAGHGLTLDLAGIDEAFADVDDRREQALLPTMATRRSAQLLVTSTAGTDVSVYLQRKVDVGRAAVLDDRRTGVAYFEWSAPADGERFPDGYEARWDDPGTWYRCMPALGHTLHLAAVEHACQTMKEGDFRRAYLNQWTKTSERVIPDEVWQAVCSPGVAPNGRLTFAIDIPPDRGSAAIAVADPDGRCELVAFDIGTGWAEEAIIAKAVRWDARVALDVGGPAGSLETPLRSAGVDIVPMRSAQVTQACGMFYDAVADQRAAVRSDERLDRALAFAGKHPVGDAWRWGRRTATGDVTPIVAVTLAHWAAKQQRDEAPVPSIVSLADV